MAALANNRDAISKYTECVRCGTVFSYTTKPEKGSEYERPSDSAFDLDHRTQLDKGTAPVACPTCHYLAPGDLLSGKMKSTVGLVFLIAFPGVALLVVKGIAAQPGLELPETLINGLALLFEGLMIALGAMAVVSLLFYHPSRFPFSKWSAKGTFMREGRPREEWGIAAPPPPPTPDAVIKAITDEIDPSKITLPPEEEEDFHPPPLPKSPPRMEPAKAAAAAAAPIQAQVVVASASAASHAPVQMASVQTAAAPIMPAPQAPVAQPISPPPAPATSPQEAPETATADHADHDTLPEHVILECPQCHKKFKAPGSVLKKLPKCKYCHVELEDTLET